MFANVQLVYVYHPPKYPYNNLARILSTPYLVRPTTRSTEHYTL